MLFRTKGMGMDESVDSIARNSGYRAIINDCSSLLIPSRHDGLILRQKNLPTSCLFP